MFALQSPPKSGLEGELRFPKSCRILRSADFRTVYDNGIRVSGSLFAAFCLERKDQAVLRIGLTVPRAIGDAVYRNRIKRRIREAFRLHRQEYPTGWDIVLNPRKGVLTATFPQIEQALRKVMEKCAHL